MIFLTFTTFIKYQIAPETSLKIIADNDALGTKAKLGSKSIL